MRFSQLFVLSLASLISAHTDIISRCREVGFNKFADQLEMFPDIVKRINERSDTRVWAVPDHQVIAAMGNNTKIHKRSANTVSSQLNHDPPSPSMRRRTGSKNMPDSNLQILYLYLEDPGLVNLGPGQPGRFISKFTGSVGNTEATYSVSSGMGATTSQNKGPYKFDKGVIYGVEDWFTLPEDWSTSIKNEKNANKFYKNVVRQGLEPKFDKTPACTVFAPIDSKRYKNWIDVRKHIICGFLGHSPALMPGTTYTSMAGTPLKITWGSDGIRRVNGQKFLSSDIITRNGVLHMIEAPFGHDDEHHGHDGYGSYDDYRN
ncbi:hypothetical protein FPQ18DRAFT_354150 [Pyronema domesticum]|nr:hypothetical protein FPQ18DRAFT_354150 [Pyronema domesticum]